MPNTAAQGEQMYKGLFGQFIDEATPGTYNPNGRRFLLTCLKGEFQPEESWANFRPDGVSVDAWNMMSKSWNIFTAEVVWDLAQIFEILPMFFGDGVVSSPTGAYQEHYAMASYGSISRKTKTFEWGTPTDCVRCTYMFPISFSHNADRDEGTIGGQIVFLCRKASATGVSMTGGTTRNAVLGFTATNVSTDGVFAIYKNGVLLGNLTFAIGDTTGQTVTKFAALGLTAAIVGTVNSASGEVHTLTGTNASGNATIYGDVVVAPGALAADLQTTVRAKNGNYANVVVAGSTTASVVPDLIDTALSSVTVLGTVGSSANAYDNNAATATAAHNSGNALQFNWTSSKMIAKARIKGSGDFRIQANAGGVNLSPVITIADDGAWHDIVSTDTTTAYAHAIIASQSAGAVIKEVEFIEVGAVATGGNGAYTFTYPSGVGNITDITSTPGTGWSTSNQQPGNAGGNIAATITSPANSNITIAKESGAGWDGGVTTPGDDGKIVIKARRPMNPKNFGFYKSTTRAGLDAASLVGKVKRFNISFENAAEAVFFAQEGNDTFDSHVDSDERSFTLGLQLAFNSPAVAEFETAANKSPSEPAWVELREIGATNERVRWQFYASPSGNRPRSANNRITAVDVPMTPVLADNPFEADLIANGGASVYVIAKRPTS